MIYPKFVPNSFWNYAEACELVGAKCPAAGAFVILPAAIAPSTPKHAAASQTVLIIFGHRF
jgi:hypothetical protein